MGYYEKRYRRRRLRRSRNAGTPPTLILFVMLCTVFLAVQWRARLLPHAIKVPRQHYSRESTKRVNWKARRAPRYAAERPAPASPPQARPMTTRISRRGSSSYALRQQHATSDLQKSPTNSSPVSVQHLATKSWYNASHMSSPPVSAQNVTQNPTASSTQAQWMLVPNLNGTGHRRVCRSYLCTLWDKIPERVPLQPLHKDNLPWVHGSQGLPLAVPMGLPERSIFTARRKGPWMGCARRDALICTGVYRSLKRTGAASLFDADCGKHLNWLPKILDKLLGEYRLVRVTCAVRGKAELAAARRVFGAKRHMQMLELNPRTATAAQLPRADVLLVRETLMRSNLISAMAFLKKVKRASKFKYIVHENFPRAASNIPTKRGLLINAALPPFSLPPPFYSHVSEHDAPGVEVACRSVPDMFATRTTPSMNELVDPRRRLVLE